jgi:hypothetical protein
MSIFMIGMALNLVACSTPKANDNSSQSEQSYDSLVARWGADKSWEDSVFGKPTCVWQRILEPGKLIAVRFTTLIDAYYTPRGEMEAVFSADFNGATFFAKCTEKCAVYVSDAEASVSDFSFIVRVDSLVLSTVHIGDVNVTVRDETSEALTDSRVAISRSIFGDVVDIMR